MDAVIRRRVTALFQSRDDLSQREFGEAIGRTASWVSAFLAGRRYANDIHVHLLKTLLRVAVPRYLAASPLAGWTKLRAIPPPSRVLTHDDETRLLAQLRPADQALYLVAVDTLIRLSNVVHLRWDAIRNGWLHLADSKTGPYRVPLSTRATAALATLPRQGAYVFPARRTAKTDRDTRGAIRRLLQRACTRAGIPYGRAQGGITWHSATRATGATRMLQAGADPTTVQAVGHWRDVRAMQRYLHTDDARLRAAVDTIGGSPFTPRSRGTRKATTQA